MRRIRATAFAALVMALHAWSAVPLSAQGGAASSGATVVGPQRGAVVVVGGGSRGPEIYAKFVDLAGGPDALVVDVPAAGGDSTYPRDWRGTRGFKAAGARNVVVLHAVDRKVADPGAFVAPLKRAGGVWFEARHHVALALAVASSGTAGAQAVAPGLVRTEFIFTTAPFASAHASTIVETPDGLVAAWFGGSRESAPDVGIWLSRHVAGAWTAPVEVATGVQADGSRFPCYNPVLFQRTDGTLLLFYKVGPGPQRWWGMLTTSRDDGRTWDTPRRLPGGILGPIKNKPVRLADGTLLSPSSTESPDDPSRWRVHFERSTDGGRTWTIVTPAAPSGAAPVDAI